MFAFDQLTYFDERNEKFKLIQSSRSFAREYLAKALLMVAFIAGALQVSKDTFVCIPVVEGDLNMATKGSNRHCTGNINASYTKDMSKSKVIATLQDSRQYDFVESKCRDMAIHWFPSYWPFILFLEAIVIVFFNSIWLKIPYASLKIDTFLSLALECYNISGTVSAISNVLRGEGNNPEGNDLEKSEAIKVKALKEKLDHFKGYTNKDKSYIFKVYFSLRVFRLLAPVVCLIINFIYYPKFEKEVTCEINGTMFDEYKCENGLIGYFIITLWVSVVILILYAVLCVIILSTFIKSTHNKILRIDLSGILGGHNAGNAVNSAPDINGDLAFMLYLLSNCNEMHLQRIGLFLLPNDTNILKYRVWKR